MTASRDIYLLKQDRSGMVWDLLLYVPTVVTLASMAIKLWYGGDHNLAYLLYFLASFFFIAGANRILKTRLMLLPSSPVSIELDKHNIYLKQRNGEAVHLLKSQRCYSDYANRSFGISGMDGSGKQQQFVFHKGQFQDTREYQRLLETLQRNFK
jgi:hypothetical protein